jgi:hypothetical protein
VEKPKANHTNSISDPGCFIPDPDQHIFLLRIQHEKWNENLFFFCFLWFQDKSLCLSQSQTDPESGKKFIPDPGSKKAPDHGYATLLTKYTKDHVEKKHTKS